MHFDKKNFMDESNLLIIDNLSVDFIAEKNERRVVDGVSFCVNRGETLGIVGESGSGKSVTSMSIMRLLPSPPARIPNGRILFKSGATTEPIDLLKLSEAEMRNYRGKHISMIFQEPMTCLNPVQKCGAQVMEMLLLHEDLPSSEAKARVIEMFNEVMLPRPEKIFDSYPHEISGGQKQRVMIAMALICNPDLLIADEPTTALDVTVQKTILDLLKSLQKRHNIGIIFISHDLGVVAQIADRVAVIYKGKIVEQGSAKEVLMHPEHPYTQGLLACRPPAEGRPKVLPTVSDYLTGNIGNSECETDAEREARHKVLYSQQPLLQVSNLMVTYPLRRNLFGKATQELNAVDSVSFSIYPGETLGLVGESGCGKTTLGRTLLRLVNQRSGSIVFDGKRLDSMSQRELRAMRPQMQIIFQDPYSSLHPRLTIGQAIMEPLQNYGMGGSSVQQKQQVVELMGHVGLDADMFDRYPHQFSGGQRQRVCIARALILKPRLVVCDESVSALDVSVQAQVLNLLNELKRRFGFTYLFISHDLSVVRFLSDRIMVMQQGKIVEDGLADDVYQSPQQSYTQKLIDAIPRIGF